MSEHQQTQQSKESKPTFQKQAIPIIQSPISNPASIIQRARINPKSLTPSDILQLQSTIGNRAVGRLLSEIRTLSKVQQVPIQRQEIPEEEEPLQGMFESKHEEETCLSCTQRQEIPEEEEPLQGKMSETIQRLEPEEEEKLQMKSIVQRQEISEEEEPLQGKMIETIQRQEIPEEEKPLKAKRENNTGMPDNLKAGVESLSGIDMNDVRVHYNSSKPTEVGALAYTQGTNIYVSPGQERHLSHEAWHVVQQAQGRVQATTQIQGVDVNDDVGLEQEADEMGAKFLSNTAQLQGAPEEQEILQGKFTPTKHTGQEQGRLQTKKSLSAPTRSDSVNISYRLVQRVLGPDLKVNDEVFDLLNPNEKKKINKVDDEKGRYELRDDPPKYDRTYLGPHELLTSDVGYYDPRYAVTPQDISPYQASLALNKKELGAYCNTPWKKMVETYPQFPGIDESDIGKFEYHFNMYMQEAVRSGITDDLLEYVGALMLQVKTESKQKLENLRSKKGIINKNEKLTFRDEVDWIIPSKGDQEEILQMLHSHTMKEMPEKLAKEIMPELIKVEGKEYGLGFHGTGRTPNTVINVHKGTSPRIRVDMAKLPDVSPFKKMNPQQHPALFRLGQKDNELFTTVSIATNFEASTDFPLIHTWKEGKSENTDDGKPKIWEEGGKTHSIITVFIVGIEKGFDTNAMQQSMRENSVGKYGEKATGPIELGNHYGYVVYERIHDGPTREDGHHFIPLKAMNLVDQSLLELHARVQTILGKMKVSGYHKGG